MTKEWRNYGPTTAATAPGLTYGNPGACIIGTKLYLFGTTGINYSGTSSQMISVFDFTTETWGTDILMPKSLDMHYGEGSSSWHQMPVMSDGRVYIPQRGLDIPYIFNPSDLSFTALTPFDGYGDSGLPPYYGIPPLSLDLSETTTRYLNGGVYYFGISKSGTSYSWNHVVRHDPIYNTWHYVGGCEPVIPVDALWGRPCIKVLDDTHVYLLASYLDPTVAYKLDVTTGAFTRSTNNCGLSGNTSNHTNAIKLPDGRMFVCGGVYNSNVSILDLDTMTFTYKTADSIIRDGPGVLIEWDGKVHIIGGYNQPSSVIYDPIADSYSGTYAMNAGYWNGGPSFINPVTKYDTSICIWSGQHLFMQYFYDDTRYAGQMFPFTRTTRTPRGVPSQRGIIG